MYSPEARLKSAHKAETKNTNIMLYHMLRGIIKLEQKIKNPRKSRIGQTTPTQ